MYCSHCGAELNPKSNYCSECGTRVASGRPTYDYSYDYSDIDPTWPYKNKIAAGVLAILLGGIGVHKFYLGKIGVGILFVAFSWTGIPAVIGIVQGIIILTQSDEDFQMKNKVQIERW